MRLQDRHAIALIGLCGIAHFIFLYVSNHTTPLLSDDFIIVSGFLRNFSASHYSGTLYPRWLGDMFSGAGAPVFVYYSPLAYFFSSIFAFPSHLGIVSLDCALTAPLILCALCNYAWLRRHTTVTVALTVAIVLFLFPSRFKTMQIDFALAQLWASVWFPLGLYCVERWHEEHNIDFLAGFTAIVSAILLTHIPSAILFCPLLCLYAFFYAKPYGRNTLFVSICGLLALGIAAIYWLPVYANWHFIQMGRYMHFVDDYSAVFAPPDATFLFFLPQLMVDEMPFLILACVAMFLSRPHEGNRLQKAKWSAIFLTIIAGLLFTPLSQPLWEHSFIFLLLQSPFRVLALLFVLSPVILLTIRQRVSLLAFATIIILAIAVDAWLVGNEYALRYQMARLPAPARMMQMKNETLSVAGEYKTIWMPKQTSPNYYKTNYDPLKQASVIQGSGKVEVAMWKDGYILLHTKNETPTTLKIKQHFFPGWKARTDKSDLAIRPDAMGLMLIDVPAGTHEIDLSFCALGARAGSLISLASLCVGACVWWRCRPRAQKWAL